MGRSDKVVGVQGVSTMRPWSSESEGATVWVQPMLSKEAAAVFVLRDYDAVLFQLATRDRAELEALIPIMVERAREVPVNELGRLLAQIQELSARRVEVTADGAVRVGAGAGRVPVLGESVVSAGA